jgi:hypothetical protein
MSMHVAGVRGPFQIILPPGISAMVFLTFGVGGQDLRPLPRWRHIYVLVL